MIVLGSDLNQISTSVDTFQGKLVLAMLRSITAEQLAVASAALRDDGFVDTTMFEAEAARLAFVAVLGRYLDNLVHPSKAAKRIVPEPLATPPESDEESSPVELKPWLN